MRESLRRWLVSRLERRLMRQNERYRQRLSETQEAIRLTRHDLTVTGSKCEAFEQRVEFLELSLDAATRWVETLIARLGFENGKLTKGPQ